MKKSSELSFTDRERLNQIDTLLKRLNTIKVIDAPVLLKLFNLYRYKIEWVNTLILSFKLSIYLNGKLWLLFEFCSRTLRCWF